MSSATPGGRFEGELDLALHLLDRQIQDAEGALVGKVDDIELTRSADGTLRRVGAAAGRQRTAAADCGGAGTSSG